MAVMKTKMEVTYLTKKVQEAKVKYIKQHAIDTAAYKKAKAQYDKDTAKYTLDLLAKLTAAAKSGKATSCSTYSQDKFIFEVDDSFAAPKRPTLDAFNPGELNTRAFDAKLAILEGCSDTTLSISVEDSDWMRVLL